MFNGRTAEQRLAALDRTLRLCRDGRESHGAVRAGLREGPWHYSLDGEQRFVVHFEHGVALAPPAGWIEAEWPQPDREPQRRELLEIMLREYRRPEDLERIYPTLLPRTGNSIPIIIALMDALGLSLSDAKLALDAACTRARQR